MTIEKPKIFCFDVSDALKQQIENSGYYVEFGSLGPILNVKKKNEYDKQDLWFEKEFPENLHEFDIIIVDFQNERIEDYKQRDRKLSVDTIRWFRSLYPQELFDTRPINLLRALSNISQRKEKTIVIEFITDVHTVSSCLVRQQGKDFYDEGKSDLNNIDIINSQVQNGYQIVPGYTSISGNEIYFCDYNDFDNKELIYSLAKYAKGSYKCKFTPQSWVKITPIFVNRHRDIVAFYNSVGNYHLFMFPDVDDKLGVVTTILNEIGPSICEDLFPFSTQYQWKSYSQYFVPNQQALLNALNKEAEDHKNNVEKINHDICENYNRFKFLHDLLTESGDSLVNAIFQYLQWLEFQDLEKTDELPETNLLEEDIHIETGKGLLLIEIKGINGTSTDDDCAQVSKIRSRRIETLKRFDVFGLYIVNHQRSLEPSKRDNPPFKPEQIKDSVINKRGLITTWDLFRAYFYVESGILSKDEIKTQLHQIGLIKFEPKRFIKLGNPLATHHKGYVVSIDLSNTPIKKGGKLIISMDDSFLIASILNLQVDNIDVDNAENGRVGIELSCQAKIESLLWIFE